MRRSLIAMVLMVASPMLRAEVCYGPQRAAGVVQPPNNGTVFVCASAGQGTIVQLAQAGWRIVRLTPLVVAGSGPGTMTADQLLIEKGRTVFRNGFGDPAGA
jgi:hypothetical protein